MNIYTPGNRGGDVVTPGSGKTGSIAQSDISRVLPRQLSTGSTRGTQTVGYGGVKIDGSNNRIVLDANDTTITIGDTSNDDNQTGINLSDSNDNSLVTLGRTLGADSTTGLTIYDGTNTRRLLGGIYPDGNIKIALSQAGYDVATATDSQLIWSSEFNTFKIVVSSTTSIPAKNLAASQLFLETITIPHGLPFIPILQAYALVNYYVPSGGATPIFTLIPAYYSLPYNALAAITNTDLTTYYISSAIDSTNIYFSYFYQTKAGPGGVGYNFPLTPIRYYLLQETASTT